MTATWMIGIDLGGTNIKAGLVNQAGQVVSLRSAATQPEQGSEAVLGRIVGLALALAEEAGSVQGLVLSCPGPVDRDGGIVLASANLNWWNLAVVPWLEARLPFPVKLEKDSDLAALGEWAFGAGQGSRSLIHLTLGTGIGMGWVLEGQPQRGARGWAGELGHITLRRSGPPCSCGKRGCLEKWVSGPALVQRAQRLRVGLPPLETAQAVTQAALAGDRGARRALLATGRDLGWTLSILANLLDPDQFLIGGGLAQAGELLLAPARQEMMRQMVRQQGEPIPVRLSALGEGAAIAGAAALWHEI